MARAGTRIVLICMLALAGCGGGVSNDEYGEQMRSAMADLEEAHGRALDSASSADADAGDFSEVRSAMNDAADRIEQIEPPEKLADAHADLVSGVRGMAEAVELIAEAQRLSGSNPTRAKQLMQQFVTDRSFLRVQDAAARIEKAGVDAGL